MFHRTDVVAFALELVRCVDNGIKYYMGELFFSGD